MNRKSFFQTLCSFLMLIMIASTSFGQFWTRNPEPTRTEGTDLEFTIYWRENGNWISSGGFGAITVKDNLRIFANIGATPYALPEGGVVNPCFDEEGPEGILEKCLVSIGCPFFLVAETTDGYLVYTPEGCEETGGMGITTE